MSMTADSAVAAPATGNTSPPNGSAGADLPGGAAPGGVARDAVATVTAVAAASAAPAQAAPREPAPRDAPSAPAEAHANGAGPHAEEIDLASASYTLPRGAKFAEIRVRRNRAARDRASFEWWTEDSSAQSGVDFVTQPRAKVTFLPGSRTASLFVKVLHRPTRKHPAKFDVVIGGASKGTLLGVSRAEVTLTASR
jgi:hypothetical protein